MVRVISQETFNDVVKENIKEFDMTLQDAVKDAEKQFEAQGVDLSNIMRDLTLDELQNEEDKLVVKVLNNIRDSLETPGPEVCLLFATLTEECNKSLAHKLVAAKHDAYSLCLTTLENNKSDLNIVSSSLNAITSLMTGHPDLLDERGIKVMMDFLDSELSESVQGQILKWTKQCCLKHEKNRQDILAAEIIGRLKKIVECENTSSSNIRLACALIRALVLDDDVRVAFGKAHDHARMISQELLCPLTDLMKKLIDEDTIADLILTVATISVRKEFCDKFEEIGGLSVLMDMFANYPKNEKLTCYDLKLLKALAGSDEVKDKIVKAGAAPYITNVMYTHRKSAKTTSAGCACLAALSLRSPENSTVLCDSGAAEAIVEGMKAHLKDADVQKQGSVAIRNIVCRTRNLTSLFLELGAEDLLQNNLTLHKDTCESEVKGALRDLGCSVKLKEPWDGKGHIYLLE